MSLSQINGRVIIGDIGTTSYTGIRILVKDGGAGLFDDIVKKFNENFFDLRKLSTGTILIGVGCVTALTIIMGIVVARTRRSVF